MLIGGGHAHLLTIENIPRFVERGIAVTVIAPLHHHYYSGMGPGMLGGDYLPEEIRFATREAVERGGGLFIEDKVIAIDGRNRRVMLDSGLSFAYDVLSCNCGSQVAAKNLPQEAGKIFTVKPIERLVALRDRIVSLGQSRGLHVAVIGGGPSAAEVAGNVLWLAESEGLLEVRVSVFCRGIFLPRSGGRARDLCRSMLIRRGVRFFEGVAVAAAQADGVQAEDGRFFAADLLCLATGVKPSPLFADSGLATGTDGGLPVNRFLQNLQYPEIFGGGDCIRFSPSPLDKVGVYAVRQNPVLFANLLAACEGGRLQPFDPGGGYLRILNLGWHRGVFEKGPLVFGGRLAFLVKDLIDRRFIRRFQRR